MPRVITSTAVPARIFPAEAARILEPSSDASKRSRNARPAEERSVGTFSWREPHPAE